MPSPNPNYCRPVILPWTMESYRQFSQICASGDLAKVAELVETVPRSQEYLTEGLRAAIAEHNISIAEFLLRRMSDIGHEIANAAASAKSLPIFELLLEHGWDINAPVLGNATVFE